MQKPEVTYDCTPRTSSTPAASPSQRLTPEQARSLGLDVPADAVEVLLYGASFDVPAAAPPLVTAEQARQVAVYVLSNWAMTYVHPSNRATAERGEQWWIDRAIQETTQAISSLLAQQQARPHPITAREVSELLHRAETAEARLREAEQAETELLEDAHAALDDAGVERAIDGNNLSVETRIVRLGNDATDLRGLLRETRPNDCCWHLP